MNINFNFNVNWNDAGQKILTLLEEVMATQAELVVEMTAIKAQLVKVGTETASLLAKIDELNAIIVAGPVSPELLEAWNAVKEQAGIVDAAVPDSPTP